MALVFIGIASLIHIYIFLMESILWGTPNINRAFGVSPAQAEQNRVFAFNQGFYNLFLAAAALGGITLNLFGRTEAGIALMIFACLSMIGAALVLLYSQPKLVRPALIQGLPPFLGLLFLLLAL